MKWTVVQLRKFRDDGMEINQTVKVTEDLMKRDPEIRGVSPIHVVGNAEIGSQNATFHLHLTGKLILPCSRTLVDVEYPIDIRSTETFILNPLENNLSESEEIHEAVGGIVDLLPVVEELLLLEIPLQVFSEEALNDKMFQAGQDWKVLTEEQYRFEQQKEKIDPRLAGLANLLKNKEEL